MASVVRSVNLFPETRFWKMGKKSEMNHVFGGLASLLLIVAISAVFLYKLVEVFNRTTLTVTSQNIYNKTLSTILTTVQASSIVKPSMIIFNILSTNLKLRAYPSVGTSDITMETCTQKHFTAVSESISYEMFPDNLCLPLNTSFTIDSVKNNLIFEISCKSGIYCSTSDRFIISVVSAQPNLYEKQKDPWVYSYQEFFYNYEDLNVRVNIDLSQEQIVTDSSLFPFETKVNTVTGLKATIQPRDQKIVSSIGGSHTIIVRGKSYYNLHNRSFLKVLDALSYIGGIFNSLLAAFFFMKMYGESSFEMDFAVRYFRKKEARNFGFMSFLKQTIYTGLKSAGCKPDWQISEKRQQLRDTVSNMMDVIYLQRRIEYLQRAITVILEPHHRKGLQLVKPKREETDQSRTKYSFRDRLIAFFKERERRPPLLQEPKDLDQHIGKAQSSNSFKEDKQTAGLPKNQALNKQSPNASQKEIAQEIKPEINAGFQKFMTIPLEDEEDIFLFQALAEETEGTSPQEIQTQVSNDLRRLIQEAQSSSDPRSRQIVDLIDDRIRDWLKETVEANKDNYLFKFNLAD